MASLALDSQDNQVKNDSSKGRQDDTVKLNIGLEEQEDHQSTSQSQSQSPSPSPAPHESPTPTSTSISPPSSPPLLEDDIWDTSDRLTSNPLTSESITSESTRLHSIHSTAGYRDGISRARDHAVQGGFDEGFLLGAAVGERVGLLVGLGEGLVSALDGRDGGDGDGGGELGRARERMEAMVGEMQKELKLENVLGPRYVLPDGQWGWDVDDAEVERGGVDAVAEAHPVIRRWVGVLVEWIGGLGVRRMGE